MFIASYLLLRHHRRRNSTNQTTRRCVYARPPVIHSVYVCNCVLPLSLAVSVQLVAARVLVAACWFVYGPDRSLCVFLCMLSWLNSCSTETNYNEARLVGRESAMFSFLCPFCSPAILPPSSVPLTTPMHLCILWPGDYDTSKTMHS